MDLYLTEDMINYEMVQNGLSTRKEALDVLLNRATTLFSKSVLTDEMNSFIDQIKVEKYLCDKIN